MILQLSAILSMVSLQVAYPQDVGKFCQVVVEIHRLGDGYSKRAANQRRQDAHTSSDEGRPRWASGDRTTRTRTSSSPR
jgi:hypothetical protein